MQKSFNDHLKLDQQAVHNLLNYDANKQRTAASLRTEWPNSDDMLKLAKAANDRATTVTLSSRDFSLRYDVKRQEVVVKPMTGIVPCGRFAYDKLDEVLKEGVH